jgi:hypothetical protein
MEFEIRRFDCIYSFEGDGRKGLGEYFIVRF